MVDLEALREALATADNVLSYSTGVLVNKKSPIFAAARELLRLMETAETVWWCEEHHSEIVNRLVDLPVCWVFATDNAAGPRSMGRCRMVEAHLTIPGDT